MSLIQIKDKYCMDEGFFVIDPKEQNQIDPHTHGFVELIYMFRGQCVHLVDGREHHARKGDLLFINYNAVHSIREGSGAVYSDILLKPEFIDESLRGRENAFALLEAGDFQSFQGAIDEKNCFIHFSGKEQKRIEMLIGWTCEEQRGKLIGDQLVLRACLSLFLTMVFRKMALPMQGKLGINENLLAYLKKHCPSHLPMEQVAKKCGYTPAYFSRQFKKFTGKNYTDYLAECRLEKACRLLEETDRSVDDILFACGFADRTKFFKRFWEKTGMTPARYQKMSKTNTENR